MSKIFLSYRREDTADVTGRIDDRLVQQFGREAVFVDVDSIPFGVDFRKHLDEQVSKCDVFLAVIGPDWTGTKNGEGKSRLEDPRDFVRIEIESALKREIPIIPVLVRGAKIPDAERLPVSVQELSYRHGLEVRPGTDFHKDVNRLIEFLKQQVRGFSETQPERNTSSKPVLNETKQATPTAPVDMVKVPKGPFLYGEKRAHAVIEHDYWIDRYPVTNEKYRTFVLTGGYENQQYWSDDGWKWKTGKNIASPEHWNDIIWNKPDHPVVGVSYYEAEAFAKWAGKHLPTELEWEKAARGQDGRQYPWGEDFDKDRCNISESGIGHTTPVNQYPNGVSPYGCYDMVGNVLEWCISCFDMRQDPCVLRGGAWGIMLASANVPYRNRFDAGNRNFLIGFRLVQDIS